MNINGNNTQKPFDQELNTYDNVNFTRVDVSGAIVDNSQLTTKLYVDSHGGGGGGGNMTYVGTTPATNYIYKALASDGKDTVKSTITDNGTTVSIGADCIANKFVKSGGTGIQYLMGDGTTLTQSASSGNSNFYLYQSKDGISAPPPTAGDVGYNNAVQGSATIIYISHLTQDVIDVEVFFNQVNQLNDLYIQDKENSLNFIKYNITGLPTIITNSYMAVPVVMSSSGGTGATSFGANHRVLLAFFSNLTEIDTRLSILESDTQNQSAISGTTTMSGNLSVSTLSNVVNIHSYPGYDMAIGVTGNTITISAGQNITLTASNGVSINKVITSIIDTDTLVPMNIGTVNSGLITLGRTGQYVYCPAIKFNALAIGLSGGNSSMYLRGGGIPYYRNTCISPFGPPLQQTGVSNFAGSAYSVQSFFMPETLDISSLIMNRSVTAATTISVSIYNSSRAQIFTSTLTATTASTLIFPAGFGMTGGEYYYFAVFGTGAGYYSGTKPGLTIVNSGLNASLQYTSFYVVSTVLPATLPTTGIVLTTIIQPPFTLVGY